METQCTQCKSSNNIKAGIFEKGQRYKCKDCGKYFYHDKITCPKCDSEGINKAGVISEKQRYVCKDCKKYFFIKKEFKKQTTELNKNQNNKLIINDNEYTPKTLEELIKNLKQELSSELDEIGFFGMEVSLLYKNEQIFICMIEPDNDFYEIASEDYKKDFNKTFNLEKLNVDIVFDFQIEEKYLKLLSLNNSDNFEENFTKLVKLINL